MNDTFLENIYKNKTLHTPDVLLCLANLSNDEVFTPPDVANKMLDLLPQELFSDPNAKFLDPACKTGVFLREIAKRLIAGLADKIPDLQTRIDHIFHNQLYGIAITELTGLLSRRSVYCSKSPNGKYSVSRFDTDEGNIRYRRVNHEFINGKCRYCGANTTYDRGEELETHAYEFIHTTNAEQIFNMKFDVIISNPPYQLSDGGGTGDSARPIYHLFVEQAKKLKPRFISMIVPSRWMKGGKGLQEFRTQMIKDTHISCIFDYEDAQECFSEIHLDGGVNYFLWEKEYSGVVHYHYKPRDQEFIYSERFLQTAVTNTVIRDYRQITIIEKTSKGSRFSEIVSTRNPYGFSADLFNDPQKYPLADLSYIPELNKYKIFGVKGIKGGAKRTVGYVYLERNEDKDGNLDKYKLFFSKAYMTTSTVPPEIVEAQPNEICTETFLQIGGFDSLTLTRNCLTEPNRRNLFLYYLPITDRWKVKTMGNAKSENGNKLQMRDESGNPIYKTRRYITKPLLCHSEFWKQRGEQMSYSVLQECFYQSTSKRYGAKRGESTSLLKYTTPEQAERFKRCADDEYDVFKNPKGIWV